MSVTVDADFLYRSELPGVPGQVRHHQHAVDLQHLLVLREGLSR